MDAFATRPLNGQPRITLHTSSKTMVLVKVKFLDSKRCRKLLCISASDHTQNESC
jgi:hypothetical protein